MADPPPPTSPSTPPSTQWVQFDESGQQQDDAAPPAPPGLPPPPTRADVIAARATAAPPHAAPPHPAPPHPAVIDAQQVTVDNGSSPPAASSSSQPTPLTNGVQQPIASRLTATSLSPLTSTPSAPTSTLASAPLHTVSLSDPVPPPPPSSVIRQGFANGDVIVTLLPQNTSLPWVTPAHFRPELVPEELMARGLTLTVEDYVHIMTQLVNDDRFKWFNMCYKRIVIVWILLGFAILLTILFASSGRQLLLFGLGIAWLVLNAAMIFLCLWAKIKMSKALERCMAGINLQLMKHKILLGLDDRGKLSCHKVNLCFIYFDTGPCIERGKHTAARYSQRWLKTLMRGGTRLGRGIAGPAHLLRTAPRHSRAHQCLCQFVEDILRYKTSESCSFCIDMAETLHGNVL